MAAAIRALVDGNDALVILRNVEKVEFQDGAAGGYLVVARFLGRPHGEVLLATSDNHEAERAMHRIYEALENDTVVDLRYGAPEPVGPMVATL